MSYDLMLFHRGESDDLLNAARRLFTAEDQDETIADPLEDEEYERQRRLVLEMLRQNGAGLRTIEHMGIRDIATFTGKSEATVGQAIESAADTLAAMGVRTFLDNWSVAVSVPYWYQGPEAEDALRDVMDYCRWLQNIGGYEVYDPQQDKVLDLKADFRDIASKYSALENRGLDG
jgi:hypothetical protein